MSICDSECSLEEVDLTQISEAELAEFKLAEPLKAIDVFPDGEIDTATAPTSPKENDENLESIEWMIQKFVTDGGDLPECYTKLGPDELDDQEEAYDELASSSQTRDGERSRHDSGETASLSLETSKKSSRPSSRRNVLNSALQGLMGEANLCYARGQMDTAEKICLEIIRQNPLAPEPFLTIAEIYETIDKVKYINFLTIAAHLKPYDREMWIRIAEMYAADGEYHKAKVYYTKGLKYLPRNWDLRLRKASIQDKLGDTNASMLDCLRAISDIPIERSELCLVTAKKVARYFHCQSKVQLALEAMESAYQVCARLFSLGDINLYLELLLLNKFYRRVIDCLFERTSLVLKMRKENGVEVPTHCLIPEDYIPDFRVKLCVSLIHLGARKLLKYLIRNIHEHITITDNNMNFYMDLSDALNQNEMYEATIQLLLPIINGNMVESPPFFWLRHADCLMNLNRIDEAIANYYHVLSLVPNCYEAKFTLSALLKQQCRHMEAIKVLDQEYDAKGKPANARLLYERCLMLKQIDDLDEYFDVGYKLLSRHSVQLHSRRELFAAAYGGSLFNAECLKNILELRTITGDKELDLQDYNKQTEDTDLTIKDEYLFFVEMMETASAMRKYILMERLCFAMVTTKRFSDYHAELEDIIVLACYFNDDCALAFSYVRDLLSRNMDNTMLWNFVALIVQKGQELRYHRCVRRLALRENCPKQIRVLLGNYHLFCGSYKYALNAYGALFKEYEDPFLALCIAVAFNQLSLQKKIIYKSAPASRAMAYINRYAELRMSPSTKQEVYYNLGRVYHQAGLLNVALSYYERALSVSNELIEEHNEIFGLTHEIAYNIHLIYRASGSPHQARRYLYKYCVV